MIVAIFSPNQNAYSETFIQAHRAIPGITTRFYYDGFCPKCLDGYGNLYSPGMTGRLKVFFKKSLGLQHFSVTEQSLLQSLQKEKVNCVLAEYGPTGASVYKVCEKAKIPLIIHFHGYDASVTEVIENYKKKYKAMFQYASFVIAVSKIMVKTLIELGCKEEKIVYNPYGPNDSFFNIESTYLNKTLIGLGRFVDKKAPYYTLLAFKKASEKHPDSHLVLAGNGPLWNTCKNLVDFLGLKSNVTLPGIISPDQFREYLLNARAFVQHSITAINGDMEGTPVGVLEACAAGVPVISTFHAGIPDVVINKETGLLTAEHDVDGMARHMCNLLEDKEYAKDLGGKAKTRIASEFSLEKHLALLKSTIFKSVNCSYSKK